MVYQRVSKPSSRNSQIRKKKRFSLDHPTIPVQAKSDSASPQEQEMPSYTPLAANWASNNPLMRSLNEAETQQQPLQLSNATNTIQRKVTKQELVKKGLVDPWKQANQDLDTAKHIGGKAILLTEKKRLQDSWKLEKTTIDTAEQEIRSWIAEIAIMNKYNSNLESINQKLDNPKNVLDQSVFQSAKDLKARLASDIESLSWEDIKKGMKDSKSTYGKYLDKIEELASRQGNLKDSKEEAKEEARKKHAETTSSPDWRYSQQNIPNIIGLLNEGEISIGTILNYYKTSYDDSKQGERSAKISINKMTKYVIHAHIKQDCKVNNKGKSPVHVKKTEATSSEHTPYIETIPETYWKDFVPNQ